MHCLVVASWFPYPENPQNGIFFQEQAKSINDKGIQVGVVSPYLRSLREKGPWLAWHAVKRTVSNIPVYAWEGRNWLTRPSGFGGFLRYPILKKIIHDYIANHGMPDIIHAHSAVYLEGLDKVCLKLNIPYILTEHCSVFIKNSLNWLERYSANSIFKNAKKIIGVSKGQLKILEKDYPVIVGKTRYIPNMVNRVFLQNKLIIKTNLDCFRFTNISFMRPIKGQIDLLYAFAKAFANNKKIKLDVIGDGVLRSKLESLATTLNISDQVLFHGLLPQNKVSALLEESHVFVLTSHFETSGVSILEAFAKGLPVVATKTIGPQQFITSENGLLCEPKSIDSIATVLIEIYKNYKQFDREAIRKACIKEFAEEVVIDKIINTYETILN